MADAEKRKPKQGPIVPRMVKPPTHEQVREILDRVMPDPPPAAPVELKIGDRMEDGTVYAGISPNTGEKMFALAADAPLRMSFNKAKEYAAKATDAKGNKGFRVPTKEELNVLFNNRAAIGGFNMTGSNPAGWYWSGTPYDYYYAYCQRFSDGDQGGYYCGFDASVRCVR